MPTPNRRRYGWALRFKPGHAQVKRLSAAAKSGLGDPQRLARNGRERRERAIHGGALPELLTVDQLASEQGVSPLAMHGRIKQARIELFGSDVSESAIYYRLARGTKLPWHSPGRCREPGCTTELPKGASRRRRYCDRHATPAARVRRHRRGPEGMPRLHDPEEQQALARQAVAREREQLVGAPQAHEDRAPDEPSALPRELGRALAERFASTVMRQASLPEGRSPEVAQAPRFSALEGEIRCECGITGSSYSAFWDGSDEAARAFAERAGRDSARLIRETPRHGWLRAPP